VSRALVRRARGVRRRTAVDGLVERHVERHREERQLDDAHRQRPAPCPPQRSCRQRADHHPRRHELRAQPRQRAEQREAGEGVHARHPLAQPQRQQRRTRQRGARRRLRVHRAAVCEERRAESHGQRRAECPWIGHHPQREPVREHHREGGDGREEQLHGPGAADRVRGSYQQRKSDPVRLVQPAPGPAAVPPQLIRIEVGVRPRRVLVEHVHVPVVHDRLGREQVVRLVAAVVRPAEGVQPERGRIGGEQHQPEGERATHRRRTLAAQAQQPSARAMIICCTSSVPSPMVRIFASR
jgi:hypothetical protein